MDIKKLSHEESSVCLSALIYILNQRQHIRVVMGKEVTVEGSLSKALKLPELLRQLESAHVAKRDLARERLFDIWPTFSLETRQQALDHCGWYEPEKLEWDDPRSNKKFDLSNKDSI